MTGAPLKLAHKLSNRLQHQENSLFTLTSHAFLNK